MAILGCSLAAIFLTPRASYAGESYAGSLEDVQVAFPGCIETYGYQGQSFAIAHLMTSRWPPTAAEEHVKSFHSQTLSLAHLRTSRWPPLAALEHVSSFQEQPLSLAHIQT